MSGSALEISTSRHSTWDDRSLQGQGLAILANGGRSLDHQSVRETRPAIASRPKHSAWTRADIEQCQWLKAGPQLRELRHRIADRGISGGESRCEIGPAPRDQSRGEARRPSLAAIALRQSCRSLRQLGESHARQGFVDGAAKARWQFHQRSIRSSIPSPSRRGNRGTR